LRENELEDAKLQFEKAKFLFETQTLPEIIKLQDQVRAEQVRNGSLTLQLEATRSGMKWTRAQFNSKTSD